MNDPVLELPGHIVHVMGSVRKIMPKIKIHPKCCSSYASAPLSPHLPGSPHSLRVDAYCGFRRHHFKDDALDDTFYF